MKTTKTTPSFYIAVVMCMLLATAGCGGGGGSGGGGTGTGASPAGSPGGAGGQPGQYVSGVAAAGAPLAGNILGAGYVTLRDSGSPPTTLGPQATGADGSYSFEVTGLVPPLFLQAVGTAGGQGFQLFSVATSAGTANINPLTNLALAVAAGTSDPSLVFANPGQYYSSVQSNMASAVQNIQQTLAPLLNAYNAGGTNFLTGSYTANGTGLDQVFDATSVILDIAAGTVTLTDKTTGDTILWPTHMTTLASGTASDKLDTGNIPSPADVAQTADDIAAITAQVKALMSLINTGATTSQVRPFFVCSPADYGVNDGRWLDAEVAFYTAWLNNRPAGASLVGTPTVMEISGDDGTPPSYTVGATTVLSDGTTYTTTPDGDDSFIFVSEGGTWKLTGNGYKSCFTRHPVRAVAYQFILSGSTQTVTGLALDAGDDGNNDLQWALVTGPGLPSGGVTIQKPVGSGVIDLVPFNPQTPYHITGTTGWWPWIDVYPLDDTTIAQIPDNAEYTFKFYDSSSNFVERRTMTLPKRPFLSTELAGAFPTINLPSHSLSSLPASGAFTFGYTLPPVTAFGAVGLQAALQLWDGSGDYAEGDASPPMNAQSSTVTRPSTGWTPSAADLELTATDVFRREMHVQWIFGQ